MMNRRAENNCHDYEFSQLDWDSDFFRVKSARLSLFSELDEKRLASLLDKCDGIGFLTIFNPTKFRQNDKWLVRNTKAYLCDTNIQFQKSRLISESILDEKVEVLNNCPFDIDIVELSENAFIHSRFNVDEKISKEKVSLIYSEWVKNAFVDNEKYFVKYVENGKTIGFILFSFTVQLARIELIAVNETYANMKIGKFMMSQLEIFVTQKGLDRINVGTQITNVKALNFYVDCGYKIIDSFNIYHLWK